MKFPHFSNARLLLALLILSIFSCKKDISFDNPTTDDESVRTPIRQYYADSSAGFCDFYQMRDSAYEPGTIKDYYNLSTTGKATKMPYAKVLSSFQVLSGRDIISGQGVPLKPHFNKELEWDDVAGVPNTVSHLTYDYNGNALWFKIEDLTMQYKTADMIQFSGTSTVVGGAGIYVRAKGQLTLQVKIDLKDPAKNIIKQQGYIEL